ncbi:hypothetical protein ACVW2K_000349 [Nocardioides sp. HB32]
MTEPVPDPEPVDTHGVPDPGPVPEVPDLVAPTNPPSDR